VVAVADSRGRFDSEGEWDPFDAKHKTDGYDLVEWLAARPWCDGKVGMMGLSCMGWTQWWTATQGPPSLRAIVPEVAPPDAFANGPYQNGVLVCWMMDWAANMAGRVGQIADTGSVGTIWVFASESREGESASPKAVGVLDVQRTAVRVG